MKIAIDCIPCFLSQVLRGVRLTRPGTPDVKIKAIMNEVLVFLQRDDILSIHAPRVGQFIYRTLNEHLGSLDPYREIKKAQNAQALEYLPAARAFVEQADDPFRAALMVSIMGNIIDLGAPTHIDVQREIEALMTSDLGIDDYTALRDDLATARTVLLLADNCGEIVFDKVLVEYLVEHYQEELGTLEELVVAVRTAPIINDATLEEAREIGLPALCRVVTSSHSPGVILEEASPEFRELYARADVVIAKGQGNFEALSDPDLRGEKPLYFLLRAKCHVMEELLGVPVGSLVLYKRGK